MEDFAKMDVFFFITTAAVVAIAIGVLVLVIHLIRLVSETREIVKLTKRDLVSLSVQLTDLVTTHGKGVVAAGLVAEGMMGLFTNLKKGGGQRGQSSSGGAKTTQRKRS